MPLAGLGIHAALIVVYVEVAGAALESEIIAAFIVWRVITLGGPLVLGLISLSWWRWRTRSDRAVAATTGEPAPPPAAGEDR